MSSNDNYAKNETNVVTSNEINNGNSSEPKTDRYGIMIELRWMYDKILIVISYDDWTNSLSFYRSSADRNYKNTEHDPKLLEILLELKCDVQKAIHRSELHNNVDGKILTHHIII